VKSNKKILHSTCRKITRFDLITTEIASKLPKKTLLLLTYIYNSMLRLTYFPILWKFSIIVMIPKPNNPPDSPESYRPISLLPLLSKIFKKLVLKRVSSVIEANLPNIQFGFRHNHFTVHQVHRLVDQISYLLEKKFDYTGAFFDIAQAFYRIWHKSLLYKLKSIFSFYCYLIFKSYLEDRHRVSMSDISPI
jgi:hypothetical protein